MKYLFKYLDKKGISIDKNEFEFQLDTHPNGGSLLGISDTLNFMNIKNQVYDVPSEYINELPNYFIALLSTENDKNELFFIERNQNGFLIVNDKKLQTNKYELIKRWQNVVLHVEDSEARNKTSIKFSLHFLWLIPILYVVFLIIFDASWFSILFSTISWAGFLFSIYALKYLFGLDNQFINNFCSLGGINSCTYLLNLEFS